MQLLTTGHHIQDVKVQELVTLRAAVRRLTPDTHTHTGEGLRFLPHGCGGGGRGTVGQTGVTCRWAGCVSSHTGRVHRTGRSCQGRGWGYPQTPPPHQA